MKLRNVIAYLCITILASVTLIQYTQKTGAENLGKETLIAVEYVGDWEYDIFASEGWIYCYIPEELRKKAKEEANKLISGVSVSTALSYLMEDNLKEIFAKVEENKYKIVLQFEKNFIFKVNGQAYSAYIKDAPRTVVFTRPKPIYEHEVVNLSIGQKK